MRAWVPVGGEGCQYSDSTSSIPLSVVGSGKSGDLGLTAVVMPPERSDLVLSANVPDVELDVLEVDRLDVESDGGDGCDLLLDLEAVEDRGLSGGVESQHQDAHFFGPKHLPEEAGKGEGVAHGCRWDWVDGGSEVVFFSLVRYRLGAVAAAGGCFGVG